MAVAGERASQVDLMHQRRQRGLRNTPVTIEPARQSCEIGRRCIYDPEEEQLYRAAHPEEAPRRAGGGCGTCGGSDGETGRSAALRTGLGLLVIGLVLGRRKR